MTQPQQSVTASISKGVNFHFQDGENNIRAFGSMFSGKEIIYVNEKEVSNKRSMSTGSIHKFTIDNVKYEVEFSVTNIILGYIDCTLIKDGTHVKTFEYKFTNDWKSALKAILLCFTIGAAVGALGIAIALSLHQAFFANGL